MIFKNLFRKRAKPVTQPTKLDRIIRATTGAAAEAGCEPPVTPAQFRRFWPRIAAVPLIRELSVPQLGRLFAAVEVHEWSGRANIVRQGQRLPRCYLIVEGSVEALTLDLQGRTTVHGPYPPGTLIGESSLIDDAPSPVSYRSAGTRATALRLTKRGLARVLQGNPDATAFLESLRRHGRDQSFLPA